MTLPVGPSFSSGDHSERSEVSSDIYHCITFVDGDTLGKVIFTNDILVKCVPLVAAGLEIKLQALAFHPVI